MIKGFFRPILWLLWDLPGFRFIWEKLYPPIPDSSRRPPSTLILWLAGLYIGLYGIMEARHERLLNRALFERGTFMTMVTSGKRSTFIAAMKNFGPIQRMEVPADPHLLKPWLWRGSTKPNLVTLWLWASLDLRSCEAESCGQIIKAENDKEKVKKWRIDLQFADLEGADLGAADLRRGHLLGANLRRANLGGAYLRGAYLRRADLRRADLRGAYLGGANLGEADLGEADLGGAYWDEHTVWPAGYTPPCPASTPAKPCHR